MNKIIIGIVIAVAVVVVVGLVPIMDIPYQATETYYESEPYVVREEYTEVQEQAVIQQKNAALMNHLFFPYFGARTFQTYIDISGKSNCLVKGQFAGQVGGSPEVDFYVSDDTDPSLNIGTPKNPIIAIGSVSGYTFSFVPNRSGIYYFRFECYIPVVRTAIQFNVELEWQETTVETQEVTKYRDVTKYRQVEKQRTVTRYEKGSIFAYLRSGF